MREDTIYDLFFASLSGIATPEQQARLAQVLENDKDVQKEYVEYIMLFTRLYRREGARVVKQIENKPSQIESLIMDLSRQEQKASPVEVDSGTQVIEVEQEDNTAPKSAGTSKIIRFYNVLVSAAAVFMFLFIIYAELFPPNYSVPVASVVDQLNVKWNSSSEHLDNNEQIFTNRPPYKLDKGIVTLAYDKDVEVVIEGPAEFRIDKKGLELAFGRVYTYVSETGRGFTVDTPNSRFVDLGTEFGVFVDDDASSELHVLKGEVQYFSGLAGAPKRSKIIKKNNARRFDAITGEVETIPIANESFARHVDSNSGLIWRGQQKLDLAKLAAGKDSWLPGDAVGINPIEAKYVDAHFNRSQKSNNQYNIFASSKFIDGVFIPDGGNGELIVNSNGDSFACPDTSGGFTNNICLFRSGVVREKSKIAPAVFNGRNLEDNPQSLMCLHSNCGITIDLEAIRRSMPEHVLSSFKSSGGITEFVKGMAGRAADVDVYILVDGEVKYQRELLKITDGVIDIDIDLNVQDRFMTIIVTDGLRETDMSGSAAWANDFFYLINPEIIFGDAKED